MTRITSVSTWLACAVLFGCSLMFAKPTLTTDEASALLRQGKEFEAQKKYAEAAAVYTHIVDARPFESTPYVLRGWVMHLQGKRAEALADLEMAVSLEPESSPALNRRGIVRQAVENFKGAAEDFAAVAQREPKDSRSRYNLAFCLLRTGQFKEALAPLGEAVTLDPEKAEYYNLRAALYDKLGDKPRALAECDKALSLAKDDKLIASIQKAKQRLSAAGETPLPSGALLPVGRPTPSAPAVVEDVVPDGVQPAVAATGLRSLPPSVQPIAAVVASAPVPVKSSAVPDASTGSPDPTPPPMVTHSSVPAASSVGGVMAITLPPALDLSKVTEEHWAGIVSQAKEGLALVYGELTPDQQKQFDAQWAPFFEFPSIEVKTYFSQLVPLVSEFVLLKEAYGKTAIACDQAQFELLSALTSDDTEAAVSLSYQLKQTKGLLGAQAARMQQLSQAVADLGPWPNVADLKKKAGKHHRAMVETISADPQSLEGTWKGKGLGWTFQILTKLRGGLLLVEGGVLQPLDQPNSWLYVQGTKSDSPENCLFWRLDLIDGGLRTRAYKPPFSGNAYDVGTFKTYPRGDKIKPLTQRKIYRPENDLDDDSDKPSSKPVDWAKLFEERVQAHREVVDVLRTGSLPRERELSRRREWAAAKAADEVDDVMNRMELEENKSRDALDREKAQGRALLREMNAQHYYYGNRPPGFDNDLKSDPVALQFSATTAPGDTPDLVTRRRRQNILLWNLHLNLQVQVKAEQNEALRSHGLTPEQGSHDIEVLKQGLARNAKSLAAVQDEGERNISIRKEREHDDIGDLQHREQEKIDELTEKQKAEVDSLNAQLVRMAERASTAEDKANYAKQVRETRARLAQIPQEYEEKRDAVRKTTREQAADRRAETKDQIAREERSTQAALANVQSDTDENMKRISLIQGKTFRRANDQGGFDEVPLALLMAEVRQKVEKEFDLPAYAQGLMDRLDSELPTTVGKMGLENYGDASAVPGNCQIELPSDLAGISRAASATRTAATPPPPPPVVVDDTAKKAAELAAAEKAGKIALFQEEIVELKKSIEGVAKKEAEISPSDRDRTKKLEGFARDRLSLDANIKAAQDQIHFVETGVFERTRTAADEFNRQMGLEDSRSTAAYWENVNRKLNRMDRLIEQARPEDRDRLRTQWNDEVSSAIAAGAKFERLDLAAKNIGDEIGSSRRKEGEAANAEAAIADRNLYLAEGVKTVASYSLTGLTMYATAGLASPVGLIMPTCAETAVSATYSMTTGYIEGGPTEAFKQAAGAYSQVAGLFSTAMDSYQQGVLNHLEEYARNPQKGPLDETHAGLSAMGWSLSQEAVKLAAMHFVVTPTLAGVKDALRTPPTTKPGGGIFGPEEMRFKTVAEMKEERLFKDKQLLGKNLMEQFRKAHTDLENARGAGKSSAELAPFVARAEAVYNAANSNFHAKNWMKRLAKLDPAVAGTWCEIDAVQKGKVIQETQAILRAQGLSEAELTCYSNSASKGSVGMDMDLGFVEPSRWKQVPDPSDPKGKAMMTVLNPEYWQWRNSLTRTDPATGLRTAISPREYARNAHEAMNEAYRKVYGHGTDEAFLEFTYSDHPEAYKDKAMLGIKDGPAWADFANVNPAWTGQAADVTGFKVNRLQKPGAPGGHDELPSLPRYSAMLEQCRGLVKDFDTKMFGAKPDTAAFGNEAGNKIKINPASPLGQAPVPVQKHFLALRAVLNDFANGKLTPSQAERQLQVLTGGQGVIEIPRQMQAVMSNFKPAK